LATIASATKVGVIRLEQQTLSNTNDARRPALFAEATALRGTEWNDHPAAEVKRA
jgi:hypothetical protein